MAAGADTLLIYGFLIALSLLYSNMLDWLCWLEYTCRYGGYLQCFSPHYYTAYQIIMSLTNYVTRIKNGQNGAKHTALGTTIITWDQIKMPIGA